MNYRVFFNRKQIIYQEGLSTSEFSKIEEKYKIFFPEELKEIFEQVLPISEGFYNWRDFSDNNVNYITSVINKPFADFYNEASAVYWNDDWGEQPDSIKRTELIIREKLMSAPKLIPLFAHRYVPMCDGKNIPVFSIHGVDIICYGMTIDDYFNNEFGETKQGLIDLSKTRAIPFWSELL